MMHVFVGLLFSLLSLVHAHPTAIIISGGMDQGHNSKVHYDNVERAAKRFSSPEWNRVYVVADGPQNDPKPNNAYQYDGVTTFTPVRLDPPSDGSPYKAATKENLLDTFQTVAKSLKPTDPVVIYVTDHGARSKLNGESIVLWGKERIYLSDLRKLIHKHLPKSNPVILVQDQCLSGRMLESMWEKSGQLRKNTCGFAAAHANETVTQPYYISKNLLTSPLDFGTAYSQLLKTTSSNTSYDPSGSMRRPYPWELLSTPLSTSDLYLEQYRKKHELSEKNSVPPRRDSLSTCNHETWIQETLPIIPQFADTLAAIFKDDLAPTPQSSQTAPTETELQAQLLRNYTGLEEMRNDFRKQALKLINQRIRNNDLRAFKNATDNLHSVKAALDSINKNFEDLKYADEADPLIATLKKEYQSSTQALKEHFAPLVLLEQRVLEKKPIQFGTAPAGIAMEKISRELSKVHKFNYTFKVASDDLDQTIQHLESYRTRYQAKIRNSIQFMIDSGDMTALNEYLEILNCEHMKLP
jgi:hypothetical protein